MQRPGLVSGGNPGYVGVGMTTCAGATPHLCQSNSRGRKGRWGGGFFAEFPLKNTGLFGFYVCNTRLEFPSAEQERVSEPPASQESIQTNLERKLRDKEQREEFRIPPLEDAILSF